MEDRVSDWKDVKDCGADIDVAELEKQIRIRRKLLSEMVGSLYPRILHAEIGQLRGMIYERRYPSAK